MKKEKVLTIIGIIVLCIALVGGTFAYFSAQGGNSTTRDVSVTSNTTDNLAFTISNDISFTVTQADLAEGGNNKSGTATATAVLTPNNKTGAASMDYYMYLNIATNEIGYSSTNLFHDAELILQVFDGSNQLVPLTGLGAQKTIKGVTGYDITGVTGLIKLFDPQTITASNNQAATDTWTIVITMINLDINQNDNTDKVVQGEIIMQKEAIVQTYATFISGSDFKDYLDEIVDETNDEYARTFIRSQTIDNQYKNSTYAVSNVTEITDNEYPIYVWYDSTNSTIYWYSEAEVVYTNEDMSNMFSDLAHMEYLDLTGFNTSRTVNMEYAFNYMAYNSNGMEYFNLGTDFDTSNVTSMQGMFNWFDLESDHDSYLNLGNKFDTSNVEDMSHMFEDAWYYGTAHVNFGSLFDTSRVQNFRNMFFFTGLKEVATNEILLDMSSAQNIISMFDGLNSGGIISNLSIDFGNCDFTNISSYNDAFNFQNTTGITFIVKDAATQARVIAMDDSNPKKLNTTNVVVRSQ